MTEESEFLKKENMNSMETIDLPSSIPEVKDGILKEMVKRAGGIVQVTRLSWEIALQERNSRASGKIARARRGCWSRGNRSDWTLTWVFQEIREKREKRSQRYKPGRAILCTPVILNRLKGMVKSIQLPLRKGKKCLVQNREGSSYWRLIVDYAEGFNYRGISRTLIRRSDYDFEINLKEPLKINFTRHLRMARNFRKPISLTERK